MLVFFFFSSRRRHTRCSRDWSSDVCSSDLVPSGGVIGTSQSWRGVLAQAAKVALAETTVLLTGESGTGKEVVAHLIHRGSRRAEGPFVALNCAALPQGLLESELFGYGKGPF